MKTLKLVFCFWALLISTYNTGCKKDNTDISSGTNPLITGMQPLSGTKGTIVTVTGTNFSNDISNVSVYVNGKYAEVTSATLSEVQFIIPAKAGTGMVSVLVNGNGATGPVFNFIYTVTVYLFSGFSLQPGSADGGPANATFNAPLGIAIDQNDNLYIADELNHCIRKVTPLGNVSTFSGNGVAGHQDGSAAAARFNFPTDIAYDAINGYFYVADKGNHCIRKINIAGDVFTVAGIPGIAGYVDAPGLSARLNTPSGVAVKGELAAVFIADQGNHCIRKLDDVGVLTTYAGSSMPGQQDGVQGAAKFSAPADITWDTAGYLYVTDIVNHNVRRINQNQQVYTVGGSGVAGFQDGAAALSEFNNPIGVIAQNNEAIVCDVLNQRLRSINTGNVVSLAGDGTAAFADGTGTQAKFNKPGGIVRNSIGDYFITDTGNNAIRRMTID